MPAFMKSPSKCPGSSCEGCASGNCYSKGGMTIAKDSGAIGNKQRHENEKGVHASTYTGGSYAGNLTKDAHKGNTSIPKKDLHEGAKESHLERLAELKSMPKPKLMAKGGDVLDRPSNENGEYSAARSYDNSKHGKGFKNLSDEDRAAVAERNKQFMKKGHERVLEKIKSQPKPHLYADGGAVSEDDTLGKKIGYPKNMAEGGEMDADGDHDGDEELHHAIGGELMDALERKDKKGIMSALEAAIMQCMGKE